MAPSESASGPLIPRNASPTSAPSSMMLTNAPSSGDSELAAPRSFRMAPPASSSPFSRLLEDFTALSVASATVFVGQLASSLIRRIFSITSAMSVPHDHGGEHHPLVVDDPLARLRAGGVVLLQAQARQPHLVRVQVEDLVRPVAVP